MFYFLFTVGVSHDVQFFNLLILTMHLSLSFWCCDPSIAYLNSNHYLSIQYVYCLFGSPLLVTLSTTIHPQIHIKIYSVILKCLHFHYIQIFSHLPLVETGHIDNFRLYLPRFGDSFTL